MATDLYSGEGEIMESSGVFGTAPASAAGGRNAKSGAVTREDTAARLFGNGPVKPDARKFKYDVTRGRSQPIGFGVTRDDRLSAEAAGSMLHDIHVMYGLAAAPEDVLYAFDSALWFCHTVNGSSVLNPGRSTFTVHGKTHTFDYAQIRDKLGENFRRFFRAYADDITDVNKKVLRAYDVDDPVAMEHWGWLQSVAHERGLSRYPHLAHDSAEACIKLSLVERQALAKSKAHVIGNTPNSADKLMSDEVVESRDRFDSSVGASY